MDFSLYYNTLSHLKLKQLYYQVYYRFKNKIKGRNIQCYPEKIGYALNITEYIVKPDSLQSNLFTFLNIKREFYGDWSNEYEVRLWMYNLNYMDYLLQDGMTTDKGASWINSFINGIDDNKCGKDPYPIALRGINWIKFISVHKNIPEDEKLKWDSSLCGQYQLLFHNLEYHLLGNHLLEDAYSLLWGAFYFKDHKFYKKACSLLTTELTEQILPDGAHYELSPMYHEILLDRLLDCINLLQNNMFFGTQNEILDFLKNKAVMMLGWLETMVYNDGSIPLLNDAANGIAPTAVEIFDYAKRLNLAWNKSQLKESGYRKYNSSKIEIVMDVGAIGPDYIPGHAHADTFNYELRINGEPFVIDTGISTYEKNKRRQYERETQAHNTVTVGNQSSSRVWGGFRVAERAYVLDMQEDEKCIVASHNGYKKMGVIHRRSFNLNDNFIEIKDSLISLSKQNGMNRIILHPDVSIIEIGKSKIITNKGEITFCGVNDLSIVDTCKVAFTYNQLLSTKIICFSFTDNMSYKIKAD